MKLLAHTAKAGSKKLNSIRDEAAELDPENKTAPMFIARTIHAQYRPGVQTPENVPKAQEAIEAYQKISKRTRRMKKLTRQSLILYGAIKEDDKLKDWITQTSRQ